MLEAEVAGVAENMILIINHKEIVEAEVVEVTGVTEDMMLMINHKEIVEAEVVESKVATAMTVIMIEEGAIEEGQVEEKAGEDVVISRYYLCMARKKSRKIHTWSR